MSSYLVITILIINAIVATISQVLLKISATKEYKNIYFEYFNPYVIFGYLLMFVTIVVNIYALKYEEWKKDRVWDYLNDNIEYEVFNNFL